MKELDIREVATLSGITPSALRFYEKKGLIKPIGRHGLRRQYHENVLNKLELIVLGQAAGFSLSEIAGIFNADGKIAIDNQRLEQRAQEIDNTIRRLQLLSQGLKHAARCTAPEHMQCPEFKKNCGERNSALKMIVPERCRFLLRLRGNYGAPNKTCSIRLPPTKQTPLRYKQPQSIL